MEWAAQEWLSALVEFVATPHPTPSETFRETF
jgi:hypothetical protein